MSTIRILCKNDTVLVHELIEFEPDEISYICACKDGKCFIAECRMSRKEHQSRNAEFVENVE